MNRFAMLTFGALMMGIPALASPALAQSTTQASPALAEASFYVANMTCALCPVTVKAAMSGVEGVRSVEIDFPARTAHVVFDSNRTNTAMIAHAAEQAGYPASRAVEP
jgi:mercuric ion binding protein